MLNINPSYRHRSLTHWSLQPNQEAANQNPPIPLCFSFCHKINIPICRSQSISCSILKKTTQQKTITFTKINKIGKNKNKISKINKIGQMFMTLLNHIQKSSDLREMLYHCTSHVQCPLLRSVSSLPLRGAWARRESTRTGQWHWETAQSHVQPQYYLPFSTGWGRALGKHQRQEKGPPGTSPVSGYSAQTDKLKVTPLLCVITSRLIFLLSSAGELFSPVWKFLVTAAVFACRYPLFTFLLPRAGVMVRCMCMKLQTSATRC